jgi:hypothetical protein
MKKTLFLVALLLHAAALFSQNGKGESQGNYYDSDIERRNLNRDHWKSLTKDMVFKEKNDKEKKAQEKREEAPSATKELDADKLTALGGVLKYALFGLIVLAAIILLYRFLANDFKLDRRIKEGPLFNIEAVEENLPEAELQGYIRQAIASGNHALAVRLYYLLAIQALSANNLIQWKKDKTNKDYIDELRPRRELLPDFKHITQVFERVWYGQSDFGREAFEAVEPLFLGFVQQVQQAKAVA